MVVHAEDSLDHGRHPPRGPDLPDEAGCLRTRRSHVRDRRPLRGGQARHGAGRRSVPQRLPTACTSARQPLTDRSPRHSQRLGNADRLPSLLVQFQRPQSPAFLPVVWDCLRRSHAPRCTTPSAPCLVRCAELSNRWGGLHTPRFASLSAEAQCPFCDAVNVLATSLVDCAATIRLSDVVAPATIDPTE